MITYHYVYAVICPITDDIKYIGKSINPEKKQPSLHISLLNKHTQVSDHFEMIKPLLDGENIGLLSESGCPGIADPGAVIVKLAHEKGIQVIPLVGRHSSDQPCLVRIERITLSHIQQRRELRQDLLKLLGIEQLVLQTVTQSRDFFL